MSLDGHTASDDYPLYRLGEDGSLTQVKCEGCAKRDRLPLRVRRGFVWWPRHCIDCGRLHLNGRRVALPLCVPCVRHRP